MDNKKYVMYGAAAGVFIVGLGVGVLVGARFGGLAKITGGTNTYQAGWDAAKKRLIETGYIMPTPIQTTALTGSVVAMQSNGMTIAVKPLGPLTDPALDMRTVQFNGGTKFYKVEQKDPIAYQNEIKQFNKGITGGATSVLATPPQPSTKTEISASAITANSTVTVMAATNIGEAKDFVATEVAIQIMPKTAAPIPAPIAR